MTTRLTSVVVILAALGCGSGTDGKDGAPGADGAAGETGAAGCLLYTSDAADE